MPPTYHLLREPGPQPLIASPLPDCKSIDSLDISTTNQLIPVDPKHRQRHMYFHISGSDWSFGKQNWPFGWRGIHSTEYIHLWPMIWVVPPPSKSHHQDYYIFSREPLAYKPSFPLLLGGGTTQPMIICVCTISKESHCIANDIHKAWGADTGHKNDLQRTFASHSLHHWIHIVYPLHHPKLSKRPLECRVSWQPGVPPRCFLVSLSVFSSCSINNVTCMEKLHGLQPADIELLQHWREMPQSIVPFETTTSMSKLKLPTHVQIQVHKNDATIYNQYKNT